MSEFDFSGRREHDEAWGESANRRFVEGDEFHSSIASLGRLDSGYRVDVSGLPEAFFGLFSEPAHFVRFYLPIISVPFSVFVV